MKHFYTTNEVAEFLRVSPRTASTRIRAINDELKAKGYWIEAGKVPVGIFHEKYAYLNLERPSHSTEED